MNTVEATSLAVFKPWFCWFVAAYDLESPFMHYVYKIRFMITSER